MSLIGNIFKDYPTHTIHALSHMLNLSYRDLESTQKYFHLSDPFFFFLNGEENFIFKVKWNGTKLTQQILDTSSTG